MDVFERGCEAFHTRLGWEVGLGGEYTYLNLGGRGRALMKALRC